MVVCMVFYLIAGRDIHPPTNGRPRFYLIVPSPKMRQRSKVQIEPFMQRDPRIGRNVGNRIIVSGQTRRLCKARVHHIAQASDLGAVPRPAIFNRLVRHIFRVLMEKMERLPKIRTDAAHLPHQPLDRPPPVFFIFRQEQSRLLGEIQQDRTGFEQYQRRTIRSATPSRSTIAGMRPFGFIVRKAGTSCSPLVISTICRT